MTRQFIQVSVKVPTTDTHPWASLAWAEANTGARHYLYQGENGDVHQLSFDGKWTHQTLSPKAE